MDNDFTAEDTPLNEFSGCHDNIVMNFQQLLSLTSLLDNHPDNAQIQLLAKNMLNFFKKVVLKHHEEEEEELFSAVLHSASKENQAKLAREYSKKLAEEHRDLEAMWAQIEPDMIKLSNAESADLDILIANKLATQYLAHAAFEEHYYLPLAAKILSKTEKSELGLSLHKRHQNM